MLEFLASGSFFGGGEIGRLLSQWEQAGIFSYALPFLLLFALVFGILSRVKIFEDNKAINAIIALVIALMALQFEFVPRFFSELFPRVGVGLSIILVLLVVVGLFLDPQKPGIGIGLMIIGVIIVIVTLVNTAGAVGWQTGDWWRDNWDTIVIIVVFLALLGVIIGATGGRNPNMTAFAYNPLGFRGQHP